MKSPVVYPMNVIVFYSIIGIGIAVAILTAAGAPLTFSNILIGLTLAFFCFLLGLVITYTSGTIFNRVVKHPVKLEELVYLRVYYLNGTTPVNFLGVHKFTGKYIFHIYGYNKPTDLEDGTLILPGIVTMYISDRIEP